MTDRDQVHHIRQGDTLPAISGVCEDDAGSPIDLSDVTEVRFRMLAKGTRELLVDAAGEVVDAASGRVRYQWIDGDTDRAGTHLAEFQLLFTGPLTLTVPNDRTVDLLVEVLTQLA